MGYRRMNIHDLKDIYRRLRGGQSIRFIRDATGFDRKTIRLYRESMTDRGLLTGNEHESDEVLMRELFTLLPSNERPSPIQDEFEKHRDEIIELVSRKDDPLKPKTVSNGDRFPEINGINFPL